MMFKPLFTFVGLFTLVLGVILIVAPRAYLSLYVPDFQVSMVFAAQRLAPAIIGLGALLLLARDLARGVFAARFAALMSLVWFGVAATGVFHYATGVAAAGILIAGVTEVILGTLFVIAARQMRPA